MSKKLNETRCKKQNHNFTVMSGTIECGGFTFLYNFDSANLSSVELVPKNLDGSTDYQSTEEIPDFEFNIWTKPDCAGTEFQNSNSTWFYFAITGGTPFSLLKFNIMNLNRQSKIYSQGMAPVYKVVPGRAQWDRIREKPSYITEENVFVLSFKHRTLENIRATTFFAFTYPFSYVDLQNMLNKIDNQFHSSVAVEQYPDSIYYHRECICYSLEKRRVELITISSHHNIMMERETRLKNLFPENHVQRPFRFCNKKVVFVSARVHPGETPSSFVLNGLLHLLLAPEDPVAMILRKTYVFKLMPMLNPDGVSKGHYRTDTRGVNLNRVYLQPSFIYHPSVYAARAIIRYHHFGREVTEEDECEAHSVCNIENVSGIETGVSALKLDEKWDFNNQKGSINTDEVPSTDQPNKSNSNSDSSFFILKEDVKNVCGDILSKTCFIDENIDHTELANSLCNSTISGLALYVDLHGHASKKGIFMYGNHFDNVDDSIECMLLPKVMSLNSQNFHFSACNFTEKNMYLRDKRDGMSREGSGRVAVYKVTGLVYCYTLECNYNTGRTVNILPPCSRDSGRPSASLLLVPPKYTPHIFEEVGRALGISLLDIIGQNPYTRIPNSEFRTVGGIRDWLRGQCIVERNRTYVTRRHPKFTSHHKVSNTFEETDPQPSTSSSMKRSVKEKENAVNKSNVARVSPYTKVQRHFSSRYKCPGSEIFIGGLKKNGKSKKVTEASLASKQSAVSKINFTKYKAPLQDKHVAGSMSVSQNFAESSKFKFENNQLKYIPLNKTRVPVLTNRNKLKRDSVTKPSPKRLKVSALVLECQRKSEDINAPCTSRLLSDVPCDTYAFSSPVNLPSSSSFNVSVCTKIKKCTKRKIIHQSPLKNLHKSAALPYHKKKSDSGKKLYKTLEKVLPTHGKCKTVAKNGNLTSVKAKKQKQTVKAKTN